MQASREQLWSRFGFTGQNARPLKSPLQPGRFCRRWQRYSGGKACGVRDNPKRGARNASRCVFAPRPRRARNDDDSVLSRLDLWSARDLPAGVGDALQLGLGIHDPPQVAHRLYRRWPTLEETAVHINSVTKVLDAFFHGTAGMKQRRALRHSLTRRCLCPPRDQGARKLRHTAAGGLLTEINRLGGGPPNRRCDTRGPSPIPTFRNAGRIGTG
jgi:hypothetical protein